MELKRTPDGKFDKGTSGNPRGRPKEDINVKELARSHTEEAIITLVQIMQTAKSDRDRAFAAEALLNRAWGRPSSTLIEAQTFEAVKSIEIKFVDPEEIVEPNQISSSIYG